ncbi:hypothetical protein Tco_1447342 [Tanacetum coccineum]
MAVSAWNRSKCRKSLLNLTTPSLELVDKPLARMYSKLKLLWEDKKDVRTKLYFTTKHDSVANGYALEEESSKSGYDELSKFMISKGFTKGTINMGLWYPKDFSFELTAFSDADHAGCIDTRKSTSGGMQFLEAEYVALSASCAQVIWMRTQLKDYGFNYNKIPLTEYQLADMFTKALPEDRFQYLVRRIGMRCLTPAELEVLTNESA